MKVKDMIAGLQQVLDEDEQTEHNRMAITFSIYVLSRLEPERELPDEIYPVVDLSEARKVRWSG